MNIIFGPIHSRRFGKSLGIDLSPSKKQCNYDCVYCELPPTQTMSSYSDILTVADILTAIEESLSTHSDIDVLTITANGEPTLYPHLLELIRGIDSIKGNTKTLILSNGSTILEPKVREALLLIDTVKLSLDCATQKCIKKIDRVDSSVSLDNIKQGMLEFSSITNNPLIIEILIVEGINDKPKEIGELNSFLLKLNPTRIDLGTIDRPPAYRVKSVSYDRLRELSLLFDSSLSLHITQRKVLEASPSPYTKDEIKATIKKRPLTHDDIEILFDNKTKQNLSQLVADGYIVMVDNNGVEFYSRNL